MAALSWPDCQKNFNRVQKLIDKIESFGTQNEEKFTVGVKQIGLGINPRDGNTDNSLAWWQSVLRQGTSAPSPKSRSYPFIDAKGNLYRFSDILKTQEFGSGGFNLGNTGEGIFACAIAARFMSKTEIISPGDVKKVIDGLNPYVAAGKGKAVTTTNKYKSANENLNTMDTVHLIIELGEKDMKNLKKDYAKYQGIVPAAAKYCNDRRVRKWADLLYRNNQSDKIEVISAGVTGALQTKVDTYVKINDKRVNINVSLKVGDVAQFGQVGGMLYKGDGKKLGQVEYFAEFGIKIGKREKEFQKFAAKKNYPKAFQVSFEEARDALIAKKVNNESIARGIAYHATLKEKKVEMVDLQMDRSVVYKFDRLVNKLKGKQITIDYVIGKSNLPSIRFLASNGERILQLRAAKGGKKSNGEQYYRSYVEKGKALKQLIGEELTLDPIQ